MKAFYDTSTDEVVGYGSDGTAVEAPLAALPAPANFDDYPFYFWKHDTGSIVLKTGQDLTDAQSRQNGETVSRLIKKHTASLDDLYSVIGSMEAMLDLTNQIVQKLMNETAITQDEKDAYNLAVNTCNTKFKLTLANVTQDIANSMLAKKSAARDAETALKNDPDYPY